MNKLLARQLRKHLPAAAADAEPLRSFLAAVSSAYDELEQDRAHIERTLEVTSLELNEANERLRREAEQNLRQLEETHRQTLEKERAERADKAKSEFLAVMSHEIRTPLNAILGFTELLVESEENQQRKLWLQTVASSGESLRSLIEDILDFSKIEAGMIELHRQRVVLADVMRTVRSMFEPRAVAKGITFVVQLGEDVPPEFTADGDRLKQVLVNLSSNAIKFTQNGSVTLRVARDDPPGTAGPHATARLRFQIIDTGIGIREDQRERIFKPFSQADSSTTRVYGGSGLGLVICQRLVRLMGGEIGFTSVFGEGTTFEFTAIVERAEVVVRPGAERAADRPGYGINVLVVEDRPANQQLMREILNRFGCHSDFADNGRIAVEAALGKRYDLVIMDLQMPEMDGFEAARLIRSNAGPTQKARIVALTASTLAEQHARCREVGMDAVLTKPLRFDALRSELDLTTTSTD
ncbi:ATP-binding protein [Nibricoccus sp. IMCC34717]|uniref:ATP-binding protein n=1 Tax=Nibricoccus sp. IMCC34717 TaxID=3034021 RepID=UPI00384E73F2